ncbi:MULTISPECIES: TatD family hydrolase [unclassified Pantoea]|uniref:TatD family hydrolase n=1 Tax=unclassified Pantoea TaxID=2630326 RepID=UPI001CD4002F|nr:MULTISPECIES: TatD family hydrolase [unclassified Pantoea]MCA1178648.1 TatD family hydrolase [Pantoea sp. alder69]MCA1252066.1 TatD family hydrolase [Pantoea sp. alder70]MCA1267137.1 TatD family hydrolase [Pantoea sp. alder81]
MRFIDTHCHFDFPPFVDDATESIARAAQSGVERIIVPSVDASRFALVSQLAQQHDALYAALGLHPINIAAHQDAHVDQLEQWLQTPDSKRVAIGEIGLDLYMQDAQFDKQTRLLDAQLKLAKQYDLPVILHSRRTHDQLALHLRRHDLPRRGVVHGFAGSQQQAERFIQLGYAIGVGGTITYERASKTRNTLASLPLTSLLLETDAPDMPLQGYQGQPNRPERARNVFDVLCQLRSESPDIIADALWQNSLRVFALPA